MATAVLAMRLKIPFFVLWDGPTLLRSSAQREKPGEVVPVAYSYVTKVVGMTSRADHPASRSTANNVSVMYDVINDIIATVSAEDDRTDV
jgi:hypothetical protein